MTESPLFWPAHFKNGVLYVLDETLLPAKLHYIKVRNTTEAVRVIRQMKTRAFGQLLVVLNTFLIEITKIEALRKGGASAQVLLKRIKKIAEALNNSRPTFPFSEVTSMVIGWADKAIGDNDDVCAVVARNISGYLHGIRARRLERIRRIASLIKDGDCVLTHCNVSGELAMAAAICQQQKKDVHFFATETRPYLQGAKLTCWELQKVGARVTLVTDSAVGSLLMDGLIDRVIVGSDRSCANGDIANKIGTYQIAVLAQEFGVPFYVLTQPSNRIKKGGDIPIEVRDANELLRFSGKKIVPGPLRGFYPGFDVVPHHLITETIAIKVN